MTVIKPDRPILLVGGGAMGSALAEGWLARGFEPTKLHVQDPASSPALSRLSKTGARVTPRFDGAEAPAAAIVLAVKPQVMDEVAPTVAAFAFPGVLVISVAAGKRLDRLASYFPAGTAMVRAMPNTPAAIGRGMTALCKNENAGPDQERLAETLMSAVGETIWIADETLMDAVTAVSGSGPAYVFLLAEALAEAGVKAGLDVDTAKRLARATVSGAGEMLARSDLDAGELRRQVTSPNGVTAAALSALMAPDGLPSLMTKAVAAATERSRELGS